MGLIFLSQAMAPTQPKKPAGGGYGRFMNEKRAEFMKLCAGQPITAVSKLAGDNWKKLSEKEKAPYQKKYEAAKAQFDKDMAAFLAAGGVKEKGAAALRSEKRKAKEGKKKKDPNAPKRPAGGGYGCFLAENRIKIVAGLPKDHKMTDVGKAAGVQWKALSDAAKKPYEQKYQKKQAAYKAAMEEYKKNNPDPVGEDEDEDEDDDEQDEEEEEEKTVPKKKARKSGA